MRWLGLALAMFLPALAQPLLIVREEPLRHLFALEALGAGLEALAQGSQEGEEAEEERYLALFAGTLEARDPALLRALEEALAAVRGSAQTGDRAGLVKAVRRALDLLDRAAQVLVPEREPSLLAGLAAWLVLRDDGVAESYEDWVRGDEGAYRRGYFLLQRLDAVFQALASGLPREARRAGEEALVVLKGFYPSPSPPARPTDPEDLERAALDLVTALEGGLGLELLPRDLAAPWALFRAQAIQTCASGPGRLREEKWLSSRLTYETYLADPLATLAPEVAEALKGLLEAPSPDCERLPSLLEEAGRSLGVP